MTNELSPRVESILRGCKTAADVASAERRRGLFGIGREMNIGAAYGMLTTPSARAAFVGALNSVVSRDPSVVQDGDELLLSRKGTNQLVHMLRDVADAVGPTWGKDDRELQAMVNARRLHPEKVKQMPRLAFGPHHDFFFDQVVLHTPLMQSRPVSLKDRFPEGGTLEWGNDGFTVKP